jgi:hypothetical protein
LFFQQNNFLCDVFPVRQQKQIETACQIMPHSCRVVRRRLNSSVLFLMCRASYWQEQTEVKEEKVSSGFPLEGYDFRRWKASNQQLLRFPYQRCKKALLIAYNVDVFKRARAMGSGWENFHRQLLLIICLNKLSSERKRITI